MLQASCWHSGYTNHNHDYTDTFYTSMLPNKLRCLQRRSVLISWMHVVGQ